MCVCGICLLCVLCYLRMFTVYTLRISVTLSFCLLFYMFVLYGLMYICICVYVQATLLNPDMCNPNFRLKRDRSEGPSYTYNFYTHNPDFT